MFRGADDTNPPVRNQELTRYTFERSDDNAAGGADCCREPRQKAKPAEKGTPARTRPGDGAATRRPSWTPLMALSYFRPLASVPVPAHCAGARTRSTPRAPAPATAPAAATSP